MGNALTPCSVSTALQDSSGSGWAGCGTSGGVGKPRSRQPVTPVRTQSPKARRAGGHRQEVASATGASLGGCCWEEAVSDRVAEDDEEILDAAELGHGHLGVSFQDLQASSPNGRLRGGDQCIAGDGIRPCDISIQANEPSKPGMGASSDDTDTASGKPPSPRRRRCCSKQCCYPFIMIVLTAGTLAVSAYMEDWATPQLNGVLKYGTIPIIAGVIGYVTNVLALEMMFLPIEFVGCFPHLKIGCGLDLPLCGWQGVIPMKAKDMAEISVSMMTKKLIRVDEVFERLDPARVASEVGPLLPDAVAGVIERAGKRHFPKLWEFLPTNVRTQVRERVVADSRHMLAKVFLDMQKNIEDVFDLKSCVVERLVANKEILNDMFRKCGKEEFVFIRETGFYLGFVLGIVQMVFWYFFKIWWVLPLCGVFVGYFTNVVALKVIFAPIEPKYFCRRRFKCQGLFLTRQHQVADLYAEMVASLVLSADVLLRALVSGPKAEFLYQLVDRHVAASVEEQAGGFKHAFLVSMGTDAWVEFRDGVCEEFRKTLPALLMAIRVYAQEAMELETTICTRLKRLPPRDFERLLHAVFEQDEIKLILVGALLGAIVGFVQAMVQTPEQLGLRMR